MKCPICKTPVPDPADRPAPPPGAAPAKSYFPFCSERCKLVDLGRWLDGKYQIPVEAPAEDSPGDTAPHLGRPNSAMDE
ncbi:MAG: DNA gyrase inhibitor YacG [Tepidisphaeraceae bacterium]